MMKKLLLEIIIFFIASTVFARPQISKGVRQTYLWDVTLSMKGYNGAPDIYKQVVDVMIKDINAITNEQTEIVVIPFQHTQYCAVWKDVATPQGKKSIINKIKSYKNNNKTNTNISAPLQYTIDNIFSTDKIDIMKLMTDGNDNVAPEKLHAILNQWCEIAKEKDAYGYYILLTDAAKNGDLSLQLRGICNFEEVDASGDISGIARIIQETPSFVEGIPINIRDEYNKPKRLDFIQHLGEEVPTGFKIQFKTLPNPYVKIDEVAEIGPDNSLEIHPKFLMTKDELIQALSTTEINDDVKIEYSATDDMSNGKFAFTRLMDSEASVLLINKPEKSVKIYVKK